jgi:hypothetical protein
MKLAKLMPFLAVEIEEGLLHLGETELASSVSELEVISRCMCDSKNCGTFYTMDKSRWSGKKLRQVVPMVNGLYAIDIFEEEIACIEIMDRENVAKKLIELYP